MVKCKARLSSQLPTHLLRSDVEPLSAAHSGVSLQHLYALIEYAIAIECGLISEQNLSWEIHISSTSSQCETHVQDDHGGAVTEPFEYERRVSIRYSKHSVY
ncbi:hypothetical protein CDAR_204301 [Caerostris darwini]|uniref:Uncharacterized protein n=1 Tax=Caerostris darwini TaxID=1538125 RepID=A0AAV4RZ19_9ARAC|nr:hypothetical protein CDAR_204301 [Caerostris darwini]